MIDARKSPHKAGREGRVVPETKSPSGAGEGLFAAKLVSTRLISPQVTDPHIQMAWTHAVRLVGFAQKASGPSALGLLPFVVHDGLRSRPVRPDGARL